MIKAIKYNTEYDSVARASVQLHRASTRHIRIQIISALLALVALSNAHAEDGNSHETTITKAWQLVSDYFPDIKQADYETKYLTHGNVIFIGPNATTFLVNPESSVVSTGNTYLLEKGKVRNINEDVLASKREATVSQFRLEDAIRFIPKEETKAVLYSFIDVDCTYCRKLHNDVPELNAAGIEVAYFPFPRTEPGSPTWQKMASVWCSKDRHEAIQNVYANREIAKTTCESDNLLVRYKELGKQLGISGTPASVTTKGTLIPGYQNTKTFISTLVGQ